MNVHDILQNPDEHVRFAAYLDKLGHVADANELDLVSRVLTDPDQTMARSAVLRYLDRRAADLYPGPTYEEWARAMTQAMIDHPLLAHQDQPQPPQRELKSAHPQLLTPMAKLRRRRTGSNLVDMGWDAVCDRSGGQLRSQVAPSVRRPR